MKMEKKKNSTFCHSLVAVICAFSLAAVTGCVSCGVANRQNKEQGEKNEKVPGKKHSFTISKIKFTIEEKYEFIKQIGLGSFSAVCSCYDRKDNRNVAIKKVTNAFDDLEDARHILREIKILSFFDHDNIVTLLDVPKPDNK